MPTAKPRITITLTDHQHAVLSALSQLQKASMSSIIVDLIDTTLPVLERLSVVLSNAASAPQSVLDEIRKSAELAESDVSSLQSSAYSALDDLVSSSAGAGSASARTVPGDEPPTSNRGVRNSRFLVKSGPISPMKKGEKNGRAQK
jgi:hypothetical protein